MKRIDSYSPLVIRTAVRGNNGRYKVVKIVLRIAYVDDRVVKRDVVLEISLLRLEAVVLELDRAHEVWVKLVNPYLGPTPLAEIQVFGNTIKYR
ncbi:MAG: hypothetical protein RQ885_10795 [Desulfurococcales archaeon]|jgi:hypothetical protein|nr:hypothetical protein [Desulfurococcales archaeon]